MLSIYDKHGTNYNVPNVIIDYQNIPCDGRTIVDTKTSTSKFFIIVVKRNDNACDFAIFTTNHTGAFKFNDCGGFTVNPNFNAITIPNNTDWEVLQIIFFM